MNYLQNQKLCTTERPQLATFILENKGKYKIFCTYSSNIALALDYATIFCHIYLSQFNHEVFAIFPRIIYLFSPGYLFYLSRLLQDNLYLLRLGIFLL